MKEISAKTVIPVTNVYPPQRYKEIKPGDVLVSMSDGMFWIAVSSNDRVLSVFPFFGGMLQHFSGKTNTVFGKIDIPEKLGRCVGR